MRKWIVVMAVAALAGATVVEAGARRVKPARGKVRDRVQDKRIKDGVRDGSLTKREAGRLAHEQKKMDRMFNRRPKGGKRRKRK